MGARHVGIVQMPAGHLPLHDVNPYDYFVDVLPDTLSEQTVRQFTN